MRIFISSKGETSLTKVTPTFSSAGRPAGNLSSSTHCVNSSQNTGQLSSMPNLLAQDLPLAVGRSPA